MRLALGTAQFGMNYGINNKSGKIKKEEAFNILDFCLKNGINTIDTSYYYGNSETVLGEYQDIYSFNIISKLPSFEPDKTEDFFYKSLKKLRVNKLYGYLVHHFKNFIENPDIYRTIEKLKHSGLIAKTGFSLYYPEELEYLLSNNINFEIVQLPYNIFDQRFFPYFEILRKKNIEVCLRSVFLQGLLLKKPEELDKKFLKVKDKINSLNDLAKNNGTPVAALCLSYALNTGASKVIVGIDNIKNLEENVRNLSYQDKIQKLLPELNNLRENDEKIILPVYWG